MDKTATLESDMEQHRDIKRKAGLIDWIYCIVIKHEMLSIRIELYSPDPAALYALSLIHIFDRPFPYGYFRIFITSHIPQRDVYKRQLPCRPAS